jgi:putative peptidoglycan lipid II flippase
MLAQVKNIAIVSGLTLGSRILGLARDVVFFAYLGATGLGSAFLFAFTVPNLFRRLFGEGALSSAFIPLFTKEIEQEGREVAFTFLNQVLTWIGTLLILCIVIVSGLWLLLGSMDQLPGRWGEAAEFGILLMPYMVLICLCALLSGALNVVEKFAAVALSQVWLNLAMIAALICGAFAFGGGSQNQVLILCAGVLIGGTIQLGIPCYLMRKEGFRYSVDFSKGEALQKLFRILLPGLFSAAVFQINIVVSRLLAFSLNDEAVSILYLCNRLLEFPIGLFTMAIVTVVFPALSKCVANNNKEGITQNYTRGVLMVWMMTLPAALGLIILADPILLLLFNWGAFKVDDVMLSAQILQIFAIGLPFYSLAALSTRGFHSMGDMRTPFYVALVVFVVNTVLSLVLMKDYGIAGLAWANVVSGCIQWISLRVLLHNKRHAFGLLHSSKASLRKIIFAAIAMSACVYYYYTGFVLKGVLELTKTDALFAVLGGIPLACVVYFGILKLFKYKFNF